MRTIVIAALFGALAACGAETSSEAEQPASSEVASLSDAVDAVERDSAKLTARMATPLPDYFDCVRVAGGLLIATHRGGPAPGYPENALETMQNALEQGFTVFEIDVAESRDGVLFLMHDRTLGRTTTLDGPVVDADWDEISRARLIDNAGTQTRFNPPKLTDVLIWAVENNAIVELDRKSSTSFRNIISAVRAAGAENHVILISYNDNDAGEIARLAPDMMLTASARGNRDISRLEQLGVERENLIAWTGTREPDPAAFDRLLREGVEPAFGTLGRRGERLDDAWLADGDASEYQELVDDGLVLLATDRPFEIAPQLDADDIAASACPR
ncbi:MAG: glycerophosphodiester phosphodiesterase family protein [Pseudomonadota bacterium]